MDKEEESRKSRKKLVILFFFINTVQVLTHFYECTHTSYHYKHFRKTWIYFKVDEVTTKKIISYKYEYPC